MTLELGDTVPEDWFRRGVVGVASITASPAAVSTLIDISGLSVTWTAQSDRRYRTTVYIASVQQNASAGTTKLRITDASNVVKQERDLTQPATYATGMTAEVIETGLSGTVTRKARVQCSAGTATIFAGSTFPAQIVVEDIGEA